MDQVVSTRQAVFLDRDNTLIYDVPYCRRPEDVRLIPQAGPAVGRLNALGFIVIVVTNQSGVDRGLFTVEDLRSVNAEMSHQLDTLGAHIDGLYYCPHLPTARCPCRKPGTLLFERACADFGIVPDRSFVVGDRGADIEAGWRIGSRAVLIRNPVGLGEVASLGRQPDLVCGNLMEFVEWLTLSGNTLASGEPKGS